MALLESIQSFSLTPLKHIGPIKDLQSENISLLEAARLRLLFVAQIVSSILALPFFLLAGLAEKILYCCTCQTDETFTILGNRFRYHLTYIVPASLVGAIAPVETAKSCFATLQTCYEENAVPLSSSQIERIST